MFNVTQAHTHAHTHTHIGINITLMPCRLPFTPFHYSAIAGCVGVCERLAVPEDGGVKGAPHTIVCFSFECNACNFFSHFFPPWLLKTRDRLFFIMESGSGTEKQLFLMNYFDFKEQPAECTVLMSAAAMATKH